MKNSLNLRKKFKELNFKFHFQSHETAAIYNDPNSDEKSSTHPIKAVPSGECLRMEDFNEGIKKIEEFREFN